MKNDNSGLLIAALVAIVAVVGLVILFKGGVQGAAVCATGESLQQLAGAYGGQGVYECAPMLVDVRYVPQTDTPLSPTPLGSSFQTRYQRKDRARAIIQRTWEY